LAAVLIAAAQVGLARGPYAPDNPLATGLDEEQKIALESIALQPEMIHPSILEVSRNGDLLVQLPALWADFELRVAPLLEPYDEDERKALQHLMRQPGLVDQLAARVGGDESDLDVLLAPYPEALRDVAHAALRDHPQLLVGLQSQVEAAVDAFELLIAGRPPGTRDAFREVVGEPALTSLLIEHFDVSQQLGGAATVDTQGTLAQLVALRREVVQARREAEAARERRRRALEQAQKLAAERAEQRRVEQATRRLYWGQYPYWGSSSCWYGDPLYDPYWSVGHGRCWYPWYRYGRYRW
jgi:hypothetical protein